MIRRRALLTLAGLPLLAACGFHPIYAARDSGAGAPAQAGLAETSIALIPDRTGQLLRQALQARFERNGSGVAQRYELIAGLSFADEGIAIQSNSAVSRIRSVGTVNWTLVDQSAQRTTLTTGWARQMDGFNILNQQYFQSDMESDAVRRRMIEALADQITLQVAAYFKNRPANPG